MNGARELVAVGAYRALSLQYRVLAASPDVGAAFAHLYESCALSADAIARVAEDAFSVVVESRAHLPAAMTEIDHATVTESRDDVVILHASAVRGPSGPVLLVGESGAGKSTLAAAMTACGYAYLGDEAVGIDATADAFVANPKPWKLDRRSRSALTDFRGAGASDDEFDGEVLVAPTDVGPVGVPGSTDAPVAIVHVAFRAGARTTITARSRADAAELLADQCFNFAHWGGPALDAVAALARRAPALRLEFGDLPTAVAALEQAVQ